MLLQNAENHDTKEATGAEIHSGDLHVSLGAFRALPPSPTPLLPPFLDHWGLCMITLMRWGLYVSITTLIPRPSQPCSLPLLILTLQRVLNNVRALVDYPVSSYALHALYFYRFVINIVLARTNYPLAILTTKFVICYMRP